MSLLIKQMYHKIIFCRIFVVTNSDYFFYKFMTIFVADCYWGQKKIIRNACWFIICEYNLVCSSLPFKREIWKIYILICTQFHNLPHTHFPAPAVHTVGHVRYRTVFHSICVENLFLLACVIFNRLCSHAYWNDFNPCVLGWSVFSFFLTELIF